MKHAGGGEPRKGYAVRALWADTAASMNHHPGRGAQRQSVTLCIPPRGGHAA